MIFELVLIFNVATPTVGSLNTILYAALTRNKLSCPTWGYCLRRSTLRLQRTLVQLGNHVKCSTFFVDLFMCTQFALVDLWQTTQSKVLITGIGLSKVRRDSEEMYKLNRKRNVCGMNPHGKLHTLPAGMITMRGAVNIASNNVRLSLSLTHF